jgi:hypothetical protein
MKILEFADLDTSRVKPAYRKVVAAIANGDFRAAQVRKLAGAGHGKLYRARLNDGNCSRPHSGRSWNWAGVGVAEKV